MENIRIKTTQPRVRTHFVHPKGSVHTEFYDHDEEIILPYNPDDLISVFLAYQGIKNDVTFLRDDDTEIPKEEMKPIIRQAHWYDKVISILTETKDEIW